MNDITRSAAMTVPVTVLVGELPADVTSHAQIFRFALATLGRSLSSVGLETSVAGEQALVSYAREDGPSATYTMNGESVDDRHFRVQPDDQRGHALEISVDGGRTFDVAASFTDHGLADGIGRAWAEGRTEKAR